MVDAEIDGLSNEHKEENKFEETKIETSQAKNRDDLATNAFQEGIAEKDNNESKAAVFAQRKPKISELRRVTEEAVEETQAD